MAIKIKRSVCVFHKYFGPLYVNGSFRDSGGTVWCGVNGVDGTSYQFYAAECARLMSDEEFDAAPKGRVTPKPVRCEELIDSEGGGRDGADVPRVVG